MLVQFNFTVIFVTVPSIPHKGLGQQSVIYISYRFIHGIPNVRPFNISTHEIQSCACFKDIMDFLIFIIIFLNPNPLSKQKKQK